MLSSSNEKSAKIIDSSNSLSKEQSKVSDLSVPKSTFSSGNDLKDRRGPLFNNINFSMLKSVMKAPAPL